MINFARPRIYDIQPTPDPYIFAVSDNWKLTKDIVLNVDVEDPANRIREASVKMRFYTHGGEILVAAVEWLGHPWSWIAEGKPELGAIAPLERDQTQSPGLSRYSADIPLSRIAFTHKGTGTGVGSIRFDIRLETDGWDVTSSYSLIISGGELEVVRLETPQDGDVFGSTPSLKWEIQEGGVSHNQKMDVHICETPDLDTHHGACVIVPIEVDELSTQLSSEQISKRKPGRYWWGIVVSRPTIAGWKPAFQTNSNRFTITKGPWAALEVEGTTVKWVEVENDTGRGLQWRIDHQGEFVLAIWAREHKRIDLAETIPEPGEYSVVLQIHDGNRYVTISNPETIVIPSDEVQPDPTSVQPPRVISPDFHRQSIAFIEYWNRGELQYRCELTYDYAFGKMVDKSTAEVISARSVRSLEGECPPSWEREGSILVDVYTGEGRDKEALQIFAGIDFQEGTVDRIGWNGGSLQVWRVPNSRSEPMDEEWEWRYTGEKLYDVATGILVHNEEVGYVYHNDVRDTRFCYWLRLIHFETNASIGGVAGPHLASWEKGESLCEPYVPSSGTIVFTHPHGEDSNMPPSLGDRSASSTPTAPTTMPSRTCLVAGRRGSIGGAQEEPVARRSLSPLASSRWAATRATPRRSARAMSCPYTWFTWTPTTSTNMR